MLYYKTQNGLKEMGTDVKKVSCISIKFKGKDGKEQTRLTDEFEKVKAFGKDRILVKDKNGFVREVESCTVVMAYKFTVKPKDKPVFSKFVLEKDVYKVSQ